MEDRMELDVIKEQFKKLGLEDYIKLLSNGELSWLDDYYDWKDAFGEVAADKAMQLVGGLVYEKENKEYFGNEGDIWVMNNGHHWHGHVFGHMIYDDNGNPLDDLGWHKIAGSDTREDCTLKVINYLKRMNGDVEGYHEVDIEADIVSIPSVWEDSETCEHEWTVISKRKKICHKCKTEITNT